MTVADELHDVSACERHIGRLREVFPELGVGAFLVRDTSNIQWLTAFDDVFDDEAAHALYVCSDAAVLHTDSRYVTACEMAARGKGIEVSAERESHAAFAAKCFSARPAAAADARLGIEDGIALSEYRQLEKEFGGTDPQGCRFIPNESFGAKRGDGSSWNNTPGVPLHSDAPRDSAPGEAPRVERDSAPGGLSQGEASRADSSRLPFVETDSVVVGLRAVKDRYEIARMRGAQAITDAAFSHIINYMRPGMTEREVQLELEEFMLRHGAQGLAFPSIVATGANGASPHAIPGATVLEAGQCVVLDFGARSHGYCSDMTRTVFLGAPDAEMRAAWEALRAANECVEAALKPGVTGKEAHELAERVLDEGGFGGRMGHGLGHGVGIDIHEEPVLSPRNDKPLAPGNVVTVEPGIYLPGRFGMRLEDFGVVTETGFDVFTQSTHEMVMI